MKLLRKISFPFLPVYYLITWSRNKLYDTGVFESRSYDLPIICVGNLSVGGTGKTPMVEYLIRFLKNDHNLTILSRGYKRKTKGFVLADETASAESIGDEPMQFHEKFEDVTVVVDADRRHGILEIMKFDTDAIILDDAFQHRKVKAGLNVLLTTYSNPFFNDHVLPTGNLREPRSGAKRADIIVVTKCPENISETQKEQFLQKMKLEKNQDVFFSWITYEVIPDQFLKQTTFALVTGIANPRPLVEHLNKKNLEFEHLQFKDHHTFSKSEIDDLKKKNLILTTEKDYMRLKNDIDPGKLFYLPIKIILDKPKEFNEKVKKFISAFKKQ